MTGRVRIIIVDDHPVVREGVVEFLRRSPEFEVVAACADGPSAIEALQQFRPELALLDFMLPGKSGLEVFEQLLNSKSAIRVVFFSASATDTQIWTAIQKGAHGVLLKETPLQELLEALKAVAAGDSLQPSAYVREAMERQTQRLARADFVRQTLTPRELEILMLAASGLSNKEIGTKLQLAEGTVKLHLHSVYRKLGIGSRMALIELVDECREQLIAL